MTARASTRALVIGALVIAAAHALAPHEAHAGRPWSLGEAHVLPAGRWELGVLAPLRVGVSDEVELSTHPVLDALMPNVTAKVAWLEDGPWTLSSEHALVYPTPLIKTLSTPGTGGIWPDATIVPHLLALHSHALLSYALDAQTFTARAGVLLAAQLTRSTLRTSDLWFVYPRTAHWVNGATLRFGLAAQGRFDGAWGYALDVDLYVMPGGEGSPVFEQSGRITWNVSGCVRLELGWAISGGDFPGPDDVAWLPTFDLIYAWW